MDGENCHASSMQAVSASASARAVAPPAVCEPWETRSACDVAIGALPRLPQGCRRKRRPNLPSSGDVTCNAAQELASTEFNYIHCIISGNMRVTANPGLGPASSMQHMPWQGTLGGDARTVCGQIVKAPGFDRYHPPEYFVWP